MRIYYNFPVEEETTVNGGPLPYARICLGAAWRVLVLALLLFLPAGRFDWPPGWLYAGLYAAWSALNIALLGRRSPALLLLRETEAPAASQGWDKAFVSFGAGLLALLLILGAADGARSPWPAAAAAAGFACVCAAYALATWSFLSNPAAIGVSAVREGQRVAEGGPYALIRHPIYLAGAVFCLATPAALGSLPAFVPGGLLAAALLARTALEDRLLLRGLPGYGAYAARVPYRLLPGIW